MKGSSPAGVAIALADAIALRSNSSKLTTIEAALKGERPVDGRRWTSHWADETLAVLLESGQYKVDRDGRSASAASACSTLKIAVIAITNNHRPNEGEVSLKSFVQRVRPELKEACLIDATNAGAPPKWKSEKQTRGLRAMERVEAARMEREADIEEAVMYLTDSDEFADLVEEIKHLAATWNAHPMCYDGHLKLLNTMINLRRDEPKVFDAMIEHIKARRRRRVRLARNVSEV